MPPLLHKPQLHSCLDMPRYKNVRMEEPDKNKFDKRMKGSGPKEWHRVFNLLSLYYIVFFIFQFVSCFLLTLDFDTSQSILARSPCKWLQVDGRSVGPGAGMEYMARWTGALLRSRKWFSASLKSE